MQAVRQVLWEEALARHPHALAPGSQVQVQLLREGPQVGAGKDTLHHIRGASRGGENELTA